MTQIILQERQNTAYFDAMKFWCFFVRAILKTNLFSLFHLRQKSKFNITQHPTLRLSTSDC